MKKKRLIIILILASGIIIGGLSLIIKKNIIGCNGESAIISDSLMLKPDPPLLMFGIPVDSYYTETGTVKRNQILSQIVGLYNLPERSLSLLCTLPKAVFDMRKIKAGNNYSWFSATGNTERGFAYGKVNNSERI